jgi:WD40 repeat protein
MMDNYRPPKDAVPPINVDINNLLVTNRHELYELHLWDAHSYAPVATLAWDRGTSTISANCAAFSHDNSLLAAGDDEGRIIIWDIRSLTEVRRFQQGGVQSICCPHRSNRFIVASERRQINVWDMVAGDKMHEIWVENSGFLGVSDVFLSLTSDDANIVFTINGEIYIWNFETARTDTTRLIDHEDYGRHCFLAASPTDPEHVVVLYSDGTVMLFNIVTHLLEPISTVSGKRPRSLRYSSDASKVYICSGVSLLSACDLGTKQCAAILAGVSLLDEGEELFNFAVASDSSKIAIAGNESKNMVVFDTECGTLVATLEGEDGNVLVYSKPNSVILM